MDALQSTLTSRDALVDELHKQVEVLQSQLAHTTELLDQAQQQLHPAEFEEDEEEEEDPEEI